MRTRDFADAHERLPSRFSHLVEIPALLIILAGDAVAFQQVVALAMPNSTTLFTWTLIAALSGAATISMHLAGVSARRRQAGAHQAGLLWSWSLILCWLLLGGTALWLRLVNAASQSSSTSAGGAFGTVPAPDAATGTPMAALMLGLYLVGGITAYGIGYGMHNPARSAYLRARREYRRASRAHRRAIVRRQRALARAAWPIWGMLSQRVLAALTPGPRPSAATTSAADGVVEEVPSYVDITDELADRQERAATGARAQAEQLRELARHRLAAALAEPARTTGVFEGHPRFAEPHIDLIRGGQA